MREVTIYYAYDDTEFDTKKDCLDYENKAMASLREIAEAYFFFDENRKIILPMWGSVNIEVWIQWFERVVENCDYVHRFNNLSKQAEDFIDYTDGFFLHNRDFNNELGFFEYDYDKARWVKVG